MPSGCKILLQVHMLTRGNFVSNEVPISKIMVFRKEGDPSYFFIIVVIYLLEAREFFFLVDTLDSWFQGRGKNRTTGIVMSCLLAAEAKILLNANLSFLWVSFLMCMTSTSIAFGSLVFLVGVEGR